MGVGRTRGVKVVSAAATDSLRTKPLDMRSVAAELNVRCLGTGEVRRTSERTVVEVQVIDGSTANQVCSDRLELEEGRGADEDTKLVAPLTRRIYQVVFTADVACAARPPTASASAVEIVLHAHNFWARNPTSVKGAVGAMKLFDQLFSWTRISRLQ
jgi:hypothetical protein